MKIKIFPTFLIIIFLMIFFGFFKGLQNSNIYIPKKNIDKDIPIFEAKIFGSDNIIQSDDIFKPDKFYLMNIWASWCIPCRAEHSFLMDLKSFKEIEIIGLNYKDKNKNAKNFLLEFKNPYSLVIIDKEGILSIQWGAYGVPETFLIYNKKILKKIVGPIDKDSILEIKKMIK